MQKETIKYLIKFTEKEKYANDLISGKLFMRPTVAFVKMFYDEYFKIFKEYDDDKFFYFVKNYSGCIGDFTEARLVGQTGIKANTCIPIFCLTCVGSSQVKYNNSETIIELDKKTVDGFASCGYKYAVLIQFDEFEKNLLKYLNDIKTIGGFGKVIYSKLQDIESIQDCFSNMKYGKNLLYKNSFFSHQKEFRIYLNHADEKYTEIMCKDSYKIYRCELSDKFYEHPVLLTELPFHIEEIDSLKEYSWKYHISNFNLKDNKYVLKVNSK